MQDQGNVQQLTVANKDNSSEERLPAKPLKHHELTPSNIMSPGCKTENIKHPILQKNSECGRTKNDVMFPTMPGLRLPRRQKSDKS